jgi:hypothetical protein
VVGEIVRDLATLGSTPHDISLFSIASRQREEEEKEGEKEGEEGRRSEPRRDKYGRVVRSRL